MNAPRTKANFGDARVDLRRSKAQQRFAAWRSLRLVLRVLPGHLELGDVLRSHLGEGPLRLLLRRRRTAAHLTCSDRVDTLSRERPKLPRFVASVGEGDTRAESKQPASRSGVRHLQGQAIQATDAPSPRLNQSADLEWRKLCFPGHGGRFLPPHLPLTHPTIVIGLWWISLDGSGRDFSHFTYEKNPLRGLVQRLAWRSRRDSNPRCRFCPHTPLAGEHLRPLGHSSAGLAF